MTAVNSANRSRQASRSMLAAAPVVDESVFTHLIIHGGSPSPGSHSHPAGNDFRLPY